MKTQISIIGCGWLGLPLAISLQNKGCNIKGTTTSIGKLALLETHNIGGYTIRLNEDGIDGNYTEFLKGSETLIINIPPGLRKNPTKNHVTEIKHLIAAVSKSSVKNIVYISSTAVFEDSIAFPVITDNSQPNAISNNGKQLIGIENMLLENTNFNTTILRFGGLFDEQRHPGKFLSGKQNIKNPNAPINLIHKQDCIAIISEILKQNIWNTTLNAVFPLHTDKYNYYTSYCKQYNLPLPIFVTSQDSKGKVIESSNLERLLSYDLKHKP